MIPVYNIEIIKNNESNNIQLTISDQFVLEVSLTEIRGKNISYSAYKKKQRSIREEQLPLRKHAYSNILKFLPPKN